MVEEGIVAGRSVRETDGNGGSPFRDAAEFEAFYAETAPALASYAGRVSGSAALAEDIVQETFCRLLRSGGKGMDAARMRGYLYRTATHIVYDHWRRAGVERRNAENRAPAIEQPRDAALGVDMARAFESLNPRERALLWLAYVEGADHMEIASTLGLSLLSVKVLLFRARRKLARILRPGGRGEGVA